MTAGGGAGKTFLRRTIGFIEADVVFAEHALTLREQLNADFEMDLVHWVDMVVRESKLHSLKLRWAPKKNGCFPVGKRGVSGIITSSQAVDPGRCPLAHSLRFHERHGGLTTHGVSCRANARCLTWTRFDGWVIQGGPRQQL